MLDAALDADEHPRTHVHLDEGEASPSLDDFDALWVLGGPMDAHDEARHPWLRREKRVIAEAVLERRLAFFGICLGHQLLADALGGRVGDAEEAEQGVFPVEPTEAGHRSGLFEGFGAAPFEVLENHTTRVLEAPPDGDVLARSARAPIQALGCGPGVASVQFHLESDPDQVVGWLEDETLGPAIRRSPGLLGASDPAARLREHVERGNRRAHALYRRWLAGALERRR